MANNQAMQGGASAILENTVIHYGTTTIINNTATRSGGGLFLYNSQLICQNNSTLTMYRNKAGWGGGGLLAWRSSILMISAGASEKSDSIIPSQSLSVNFIKNQAELGGGIRLVNTKMYVFATHNLRQLVLNFTENFATFYGGAMYR